MATYSFQLNWSIWDMMLDSAGNWAIFDPSTYAESVAQDAACAFKTFLGDCWYNNRLGMPYLQSIFGQQPPLSFVSAKLIAQALTMSNIDRVVILALGLRNVVRGNSTLSTLTGSVLVWPKGSSTPVPVTF